LSHDPPLVVVLLPCVATVGDRFAVAEVAKILVQFFELGIHQGIHRIDDDSLDGCLGAVVLLFENGIDDGQYVSKGLAGAGAGGENIALAFVGQLDGILLVLVEAGG